MDTSMNKISMGQERLLAETESIIQVHLSKDGLTLDLTAEYLKEYGAKDIARMEFLRPLTNLAFGTNLCGPKGVRYFAQSEVLVNLTSLNLFYNQIGEKRKEFGQKQCSLIGNLIIRNDQVLQTQKIV